MFCIFEFKLSSSFVSSWSELDTDRWIDDDRWLLNRRPFCCPLGKHCYHHLSVMISPFLAWPERLVCFLLPSISVSFSLPFFPCHFEVAIKCFSRFRREKEEMRNQETPSISLFSRNKKVSMERDALSPSLNCTSRYNERSKDSQSCLAHTFYL